jgi:hypothetical protein
VDNLPFSVSVLYFGGNWPGPKETLERVDKAKGKYYTRSKYLQKIIEEHLNSLESEKKKWKL